MFGPNRIYFLRSHTQYIYGIYYILCCRSLYGISQWYILNLYAVIDYGGLHLRVFVEADRLRVGLFN